MENNLFQEIQYKRSQMKILAQEAKEKKWIDEQEYNNIIKKIDNDTLTIGVIGQMKCGKSTFLNSFLFGDEVLPAATTPMTAALSVITYGEEKSVEAEFYDSDEWSEMKIQARRDVEEAEGDKAEESKIKAAKELVSKVSKIEDKELSTLLGSKKKDRFENLIEYVGADGKYVAITKSVTIYYPKEWLKGVEIVDTPGFNDPVVSREERTQEFLKRADVVLMLLYAGRAFDATDRDIVFEKVRSVGVGKILVGVNKYDLCYTAGETIEEIKENVTNEIRKACREYRNSAISELLEDVNPIPFSANMALMAKMPISKVEKNEDVLFHWKRACDTFEISSQKEMLEKSLVKNLENAIKEMLEKSKADILFKKPVNMIFQAGENIKTKKETELAEKKIHLAAWNTSDDDLQEKIENLNRAERKIKRKLENIIYDLSYAYDKEVRIISRKFDNLIDSTEKELENIVNTEERNQIKRNIEKTIEKAEREVKYMQESAQDELKKVLLIQAENFNDKIEEVIKKHDKGEEAEDILQKFRGIIKNITYITNNSQIVEKPEKAISKQEKSSIGLGHILGGGAILATSLIFPIVGMSLLSGGIGGGIGGGVTYLISFKDEWRKKLDNEIFPKLRKAVPPFIEKIKEGKTAYISIFEDKALSNVLKSIIEQLEEVQKQQSDKEEKIATLKSEEEKLKSDLKTINSQISELQPLKNSII